jgi:hypothetical protein
MNTRISPISLCALDALLDFLVYLFAFLLLLITASTVVEVANLGAVENRFVDSFVDKVVHEAKPARGGVATTRLGRVLGEDSAEVFGALAAGV